MNVVVIGAAGGIGRCLVVQAREAGHQVTAMVRSRSALPAELDGARIVEGDVLDRESLRAAITGQRAVLCAIGTGSKERTTLRTVGAGNIVAVMKDQNVRRLLFVSNFGVMGETGPDLRTKTMMLAASILIRNVLADQRGALKVIVKSDLDWIAVRPLALTDGPRTGSYRVVASGLPAGGSRIARADVADFMVRQLSSDEYLGKIPAIAY